MRTRIQKWGNSLALRIPKSFAAEANIEQHPQVEVSVQDGRIAICRVVDHVPTLEELVAGITEENRHPEVDFGPPVGREAW